MINSYRWAAVISTTENFSASAYLSTSVCSGRPRVLGLRLKIAGFFRERRMEKGRHLASYAYEYVPRSRPLFARIHTFERVFSLRRNTPPWNTVGREKRREAGGFSFGNHCEWRLGEGLTKAPKRDRTPTSVDDEDDRFLRGTVRTVGKFSSPNRSNVARK